RVRGEIRRERERVCVCVCVDVYRCVCVCAGIELRETSVRYYESCMERKCKPAYVCLLGPQGIRPVYVCVFTSVSGSVFMCMNVCVCVHVCEGCVFACV